MPTEPISPEDLIGHGIVMICGATRASNSVKIWLDDNSIVTLTSGIVLRGNVDRMDYQKKVTSCKFILRSTVNVLTIKTEDDKVAEINYSHGVKPIMTRFVQSKLKRYKLIKVNYSFDKLGDVFYGVPRDDGIVIAGQRVIDGTFREWAYLKGHVQEIGEYS